MKPIKIVYSWIGPRGPIWNTELPNVLSFAAASIGAATDSRMWWADDVWHKTFNPRRPEYELHPACLIEEDDVFIYPFSLAWRITMRNYFLNTSGLLEFGHVPESIIHHVKNSKGYFLIDLSAEAFVQEDQLRAMTSYFQAGHGIPMEKIIYLTGCMNANKLYEDFCKRNNLPDDPIHRMNILSYPISQQGLASHLSSNPPEPEYDTEKVPDRVFLMWNRRFRRHRTTLALALDKAGLVDRSFVSMNMVDPEHAMMKFTSMVDLFSNPDLQITSSDAGKFISKLPLVIDGETQINQMCQDFDNAARQFYQNSLVSIVTETNYDLPELTLTEKAFKPSKEKHPFIIVGVPGALKAMRELGWQTFSEFWDESYDDIEDPKRRMRAIVDVCKHIGSWTPEQIIEFRRKVKPILDNNYNALKKDSALFIADKISKIIRERFSI